MTDKERLVTTKASKVRTKEVEMWAAGWSPVEFYNTTRKLSEYCLCGSFNPRVPLRIIPLGVCYVFYFQPENKSSD